ncbi:MAG: hydroxymethylbilane synthase, partial [Planctomycetota bacterium]
MRRSRKPITIAARPSRLARIQAEMVGRGLQKLHPNVDVRYRWVESDGDRQDQRALSEIGGKGLFVSAVEQALLDGHADLAVHSMKDMPCDTATPGLTIAAVPRRAEAHDVLVAPAGVTRLEDLPQGAVLGTASPRRAAQARALRPDLRPALMRGNVETRLAKAASPDSGYHATLLAACGLRRLGLRDSTEAAPLPVEAMLPAAAQGALCLQCRAGDHVTLTRCLPLNHPLSAAAIHAERAVVAGLAAGCHSPVAVFAEPVGIEQAAGAARNADAHWFRLRAKVVSIDGRLAADFDQRVKTRDLGRLPAHAVRALLDQGAADLLAEADQRGPAVL